MEHDLDLSAHQARSVTPELVREATIIFAMSHGHLRRVEAMGGAGKTHLLGSYAGLEGEDGEIPDPFGGDLDEYRATYDRLLPLVRGALDRLLAERAGGEPH